MLELNAKTCLALASLATLLAACHAPPPVPRAVLRISAAGDFELDGRPVALADLEPALQARRSQAAASGLELEFRASTGADMKAVRAAVDAAKQAHVRVSFAGEGGPARSRPAGNLTSAEGD